MTLNLLHDGRQFRRKCCYSDRGRSLIHLCVRDAVHHGPGMQTTRSTVHCTHDGVLENGNILNVREIAPHRDGGDHGCDGVALLCHLLKNIDPPGVAVTLLASGLEMIPHGDYGDHGGNVALLRRLLKDIRYPALEATSLASGLEELVPDIRVLGVHRYGHYRDDVDAVLLTNRVHVLSPCYDRFCHEH